MDSPAAIHAPAVAPAIDYDRIIRVLVMLEQNPWSKPGGALGFMPDSWKEETTLSYRLASDPAQATIIAKLRLARFAAIAARRGVKWTPTVAFDSWRWGIGAALHHSVNWRSSYYAERGANLFYDPSFK